MNTQSDGSNDNSSDPTNAAPMFRTYLPNNKDLPIGAKNLFLKNQYLLDLHHKSDEDNTLQKWRYMALNGEFKGLNGGQGSKAWVGFNNPSTNQSLQNQPKNNVINASTQIT